MTPVSETGDPVSKAPAPTGLAAGPQSIVPQGFGATMPGAPSVNSAFPAGQNAVDGGLQAVTPVPGRSNSGITIGTLQGVDASSAGLIGENDGGFGTNMWLGATRADVDTYLAVMPVATGSPAVDDLSRRLLLTSATPPEGEASGTSLLALRLDRLIASGHADLAAELGRSAQADKTPAVVVARAKAALATGKTQDACAALADLPTGSDPAHDETAAFTLKLSAYCQISSGNKTAAGLTLDLAREEALDDPLFFSLAYQASDGVKLKAAEPKKLDILDVAFYKLAGRDLPKNAAAMVPPAMLADLSKDGKLSVEARIGAGEHAAADGLIKGEDLAALYRLPKFTADDIDGVKAGTYPASQELRRALLFQAIDAEVSPVDRAELMSTFLATGDSVGLSAATTAVLLPMIKQLTPSPTLRMFAPVAVRTFLLAGDRSQAQSWYALVGSASVPPAGAQAGLEPVGGSLGREARVLGALMRISDPKGPGGDPDQVAADIVADLRSGVAANQNFGALEAMLLDAQGYPLPQPVLDALPLAPKSQGAPEALLNQLHAAGLKGSVGEVVLLSLVAIGPGGPDRADRQALAQSVSSLRAVHLDGEARRLATEALMGRSHAGPG
ncbi:MAG: hypothetical protein P4L72_00495 [Parvibaculum sp.]|uniref:hypothetical protein n=1 Tax=Parvibaculum sp. TaxID=2024848 RepID=UPI00283E4E32|nr:hypothetical protein [Parvibaculum sp.]MDR3497684.1 hypothetical protein [Parvibaculum sp.]